MSTKATALSFNARNVAPTENTVVIPSGWQNATVTDGVAAATKGPKKGVCLTIEFTILDGEHKGRKVWNRFNIENANEKAQEIGQRDLSALCHATGVMDVSNDKCFNGKNLQIKIGVDKADDAAKEKGYEDKNNTKGYKPLEGAAAAPAFIPNGPPSNVTNFPAAPGSPAAPAAPSVPVAAPSFPPEGWTQHPADPNYYFKGEEVLTVDDLKAKFAPAPVAAPVVPSVPAAPAVPSAPAVPAAPVPPVAAPFPPEGWTTHPQSPGYFYQGQEVLTEADLRARVAAPAVASSEVPPWER